MDRSPQPDHDVIVVGARCAGAATALLLARAGHDVVLVDRATFPSDTLSTHAMSRTGVLQLHRWGLYDQVVSSGAPELRDIEFHDDSGIVRRRLKERCGVDALLAPRRIVLDAILVDAAVAAGARLHTGVTIEGLQQDDSGRVVGVHGRHDTGAWACRARLVVGADGLRSRVARSVGAEVVLAGPATGSTHFAYVAGDWPALEYHHGRRALGGVFPTHGGEACVWVCAPAAEVAPVRHAAASVDDTLQRLLSDRLPELHARIAGLPTSRARGAMALPNHLRRSVGEGWALVGDAGYHRDPITGHGMSDAFRDADLLASAIDEVLRGSDEQEALRDYEDVRRRMLEPFLEVTCAMVELPDREGMRVLQGRLSELIERETACLATWTSRDRHRVA